jgi:regulator of sirC expression with transglutaminase-like and TPR domain
LPRAGKQLGIPTVPLSDRLWAEKSLQRALQLDPRMPQPYLQLVNLYLQQKRAPDAIAELEAYLKVFPDSRFSPKARESLKRLQAEAGATPAQH